MIRVFHAEATAMVRKTRSPLIALGIALVVGILATRGWIFILNNDLLYRWSRVPAPPLAGVTLVTIWQTTLYAQAPSGEILAIVPNRETTWTRHAPLPTTDPYQSKRLFVGTCDVTDARFRWTAAPPSDIRECLEAQSRISVVYFTLSVIRDGQDRLWYFQTGGSDFFLDGFLSVFLCFLAATTLGYGVARAILG
jgi:hypothetical protein